MSLNPYVTTYLYQPGLHFFMRLFALTHYFYKSLVLCCTLVLVLSCQIPYYSYSSTADLSNSDNASLQITEELDDTNDTIFSLDLSDNSTANSTTSSILPNSSISASGNGAVNLDLPQSIVDLLGSAPPLADQQNITENLTSTNNTVVMTTNETQLAGTENVTILANFTSKPLGLETDYAISEKPIIIVNNAPLNYQYMNDPTDEVTITDMLISLRASIKLDNSSNALPLQLRVFSNPTNVTENADGSRTYINDPTNIENMEIAGVIFSEARTTASIYPNGTGTLNATNIEE